MELADKIYVAGHSGLVGSALVRALRKQGHQNVVLRTHGELDLTDQYATHAFFAQERPKFVFLAAAKVGGILANHSFPADFILQNLKIETNVISACYETKVDRLLFVASSCIYPKLATQPLRESSLLTGPLEPTNRPYAIAKIAGIEMCWALNRQYRTQFLAAMCTNLYGPCDSYQDTNSHLIPALLLRMHRAKLLGATHVDVWGTGTVRREFLYSEDAADACVFLMNLPAEKFNGLVSSDTAPPAINIGLGQDITISEVALLIAKIVGFKGKLVFDPAKPDGTPRKLLDLTLMNTLGWRSKTDLHSGIALAYKDFVSNVPARPVCIDRTSQPSQACVGSVRAEK